MGPQPSGRIPDNWREPGAAVSSAPLSWPSGPFSGEDHGKVHQKERDKIAKSRKEWRELRSAHARGLEPTPRAAKALLELQNLHWSVRFRWRLLETAKAARL